MAEDVNFLLDQMRATSSFQDLRRTLQESGKPPRTEDQKEELNKPREEKEQQEQQSVDKTLSLKSKIQVFQEVDKETKVVSKKPIERQNQETQQDIAPAERRELQSSRQEVSKDARAESRNPRSQGPSGVNELVRTSKGSAKGPQENSNEDPNPGGDLANQLMYLSAINRIEKFQNGVQIDSVEESAKRAREDDIAAEQELLASQTRNKLTIRDLAKDFSEVKDSESLEQLITTDESTTVDLQDNRLAANDTRTQERLNEEQVAEEADAFRNDAKLNMPTQVIEPVERQAEAIKEELNTNSLPGPRPLESSDVNGSSLETERGQNISKLI